MSSRRSRSRSKKPIVRRRRSSSKTSYDQCYKNKVSTVMHEYKRGELKTSVGRKVKNHRQAVAIALSVASRHCK